MDPSNPYKPAVDISRNSVNKLNLHTRAVSIQDKQENVNKLPLEEKLNKSFNSCKQLDDSFLKEIRKKEEFGIEGYNISL